MPLLLVIGLASGFLSGLFGIGGGTIIVPALVAYGFTQRNAAATSLVAIIPTSIVGVVSYLVAGNVDFFAGVLLAIGMIAGTQVGSHLLARLPERVLRWAFLVFLVIIAVIEFSIEPTRGGEVDHSVLMTVFLLVAGFITGILSGVLGIGGGVVVVPALTTIFHMGDLTARGTSLLMMIPGSIAGSYSHYKKKLASFRTGLTIGVAACVAAPFGTWVAGLLSPRAGSILFACYIVALIVRSLWVALRKPVKG